MPERNEQFPTALQACLLVVALFLTEVLVYALLHDLNRALGLGDDAQQALAVVIGNGLVLSAVLQFKGLGHRELIHASSTSARATFWLLLLPILLVTPALVLMLGTLNEWLTRLLPLSAWEADAFARMADGSLAMVLSVCVLAPVLEEMLFRGIVLRSFLLLYPRGAAIAGSALLFGFAHLNIHQFLVALVIGGLSGHLYARTRSLLPSISLHAAFNTAITLLGSVQPDEAAETAEAVGPSVAVWVGALALGATGLWLLLRLLRQPARS